MNTILKGAAVLALVSCCLTSFAQEGDKMMKKEDKMDRKQQRENQQMMRSGKAKKENKSMKIKLKDGNKMEVREQSAQ